MNLTFASILWLDDVRRPDFNPVITWVKNYDQFVNYLTTHDMPELICFDHDLSFEHYPLSEQNATLTIPYDSYKEKTGLHCARFIVENKLPLQYWSIHSYNIVGRNNIEAELRQYCPGGEVRNLRIPFTNSW